MERTSFKINKIFLMILVIVMLISSVGCSETIWTKEYEYDFLQSSENISSVKIMRYDDKTNSIVEVIKTLDEDSGRALYEDFSATSCGKTFGDHASGYGEVIIYIEYENGEADIIGFVNSGTVDKSGEWGVNVKYFRPDDFAMIVIKYVDRELVPELEAAIRYQQAQTEQQKQT